MRRSSVEVSPLSTWMVVEDEPGIYEVLMAMFQLWGIEGAAFVDGEEAYAWIEEVDSGQFRGELPELALIDIRMPGAIQGNDVAERMRKSRTLGGIPIVLTTAYELTHAQYFAIMAQTHADQLLRKPLPKFEMLKRTLESIIEARRARGGANLIDTPPMPPPVRGAPYLPGGVRATKSTVNRTVLPRDDRANSPTNMPAPIAPHDEFAGRADNPSHDSVVNSSTPSPEPYPVAPREDGKKHP